MLVLVDTNVVLDRFHQRQPWYSETADFWGEIAAGRITGYISASSVTDLWYISRRIGGLAVAQALVKDTLNAFEVIPVDRRMLEDALLEPGSDFEDNLQIVCAREAGLDAIVTRDPAGFRSSPLPVVTPAEAVAQLGRTGDDGR